jgi:hypothetical protein
MRISAQARFAPIARPERLGAFRRRAARDDSRRSSSRVYRAD